MPARACRSKASSVVPAYAVKLATSLKARRGAFVVRARRLTPDFASDALQRRCALRTVERRHSRMPLRGVERRGTTIT